MTSANIAVLKGEVLHSGNPSANIAVLKGEVLHSGNPSAKIAVIKGEVFYALPPPVTAGRRVTVIINNY